MSETLLHCFACDAFTPQNDDLLECGQCRSDFVEIVQVERSPAVPGNRPTTTSQEAQSEHSQTTGVPGLPGILSSLLQSILPAGLTAPMESENNATTNDAGSQQHTAGISTNQAAEQYSEQTQPPPFNDFFSQMFGQFPQGRATPSPLGNSTHSRTTHGPGGSSFTFSFGTSSGNVAHFDRSQEHGTDIPQSQQMPLPMGWHFGPNQGFQGIPQIHNFPDLASVLSQALETVPGRTGYASGETFDNIISELMNRNPQSNVVPASDLAIAQIRRILLEKGAEGLSGSKIGEECSICQDDYRDGETLVDLNCHHIYHEECLLSWIKTNRMCPICRAPVTEDEELLEQETLD